MVFHGAYPPFEGNVLLKHAMWVIVGSSLERLTYYTITGSLTTFFTRELKMDATFAQQMQAVLQSIVYVLPVVGAFIADTYTGRYKICVIALSITVAGCACLTAGAYMAIDWLSLLSLFVLFALPVAMVKPNLIVLGADQFNPNIPAQLAQRDNYFGALYVSTNVAAATAFMVMNQIAVEGMGVVKQENSFSFVFLMGTIFCLISLSMLVFGSKKIYAMTPTGSVLTSFAKVTKAALKNAPTKKGHILLTGLALLFIAILASIPSFFFDAPALDYTLAAIIMIACAIMIIFGRDSTWMNNAAISNPAMYSLDDVNVKAGRDVYRLFPYMAFAIPFWGIYNQMNTGFISQGCQMSNLVGTFRVAPTTMPTYNSIVIIIIMPILNYVIYPSFKKCGGGRFTLTPLRRIGIGFVVTALAMIFAAIMENARRNAPIVMTECDQAAIELNWCTAAQEGDSIPELSSCYAYEAGDTASHIPKNDLTIFWQILSYGCIGIAECMVAATYYDFFYSQVPAEMRSVCQALQMLTTSLGTMVGAVINSICISWLPNNLNDGHQDYLYYVNAAFMLIFWAIFVVVSRGFQYAPGTSLMPGDVVVSPETAVAQAPLKRTASGHKIDYEYYYYEKPL